MVSGQSVPSYAPARVGSTGTSSVTRFVWSGDQILWENKEAQGSYASEAGGRVSYVHAGGIDRPLAIWKQGVGTIVTHQNWRGQFAMGTYTSGQPSDCRQYPPSGCVPVNWPGWATTAWHEKMGQAPTTGYEHYWLGSLAVGMRDASGQIYKRNRYYDPQTGQFTQPDPIGLAGGLNAYGFAEGDPVSYSDPYGLSVCCPWGSGLSGTQVMEIVRRVGQKVAPAQPFIETAFEASLALFPLGGGASVLSKTRMITRASGGVRISNTLTRTRVIGHAQDMETFASGFGRTFNVSEDGYSWAANKAWLDDAAKNAEDFILATPLKDVRPGSVLEREISYLTTVKGYRIEGQTLLSAPKR